MNRERDRATQKPNERENIKIMKQFSDSFSFLVFHSKLTGLINKRRSLFKLYSLLENEGKNWNGK